MSSKLQNEDEDLPEYEVEDIVMHMPDPRGEGVIYLVKWKNYDSDRNTWEPESHLTCPQILARYKARFPQAFNRKRGKPLRASSQSASPSPSSGEATSSKNVGRKSVRTKVGSGSGKRAKREISVEISHSLRREVSVPNRLILANADEPRRARGRPRKTRPDDQEAVVYGLRSRAVVDPVEKAQKQSGDSASAPKLTNLLQRRKSPVRTQKSQQLEEQPSVSLVPPPVRSPKTSVSKDMHFNVPIVSKNAGVSRKKVSQAAKPDPVEDEETEYMPIEVWNELLMSDAGVEEYCDCDCHK